MQTTILLNKDDDYGFLTLRPTKNYLQNDFACKNRNFSCTAKPLSMNDLLEAGESNLDQSYDRKNICSEISISNERCKKPSLRRGLSASQPTLNRSKNKNSYKVRLAISSDILNKISDDKQPDKSKRSTVVFLDENGKDEKKKTQKSWWKNLFSKKKSNKYKGPTMLKDSLHVTSSVEVVEDLSFDDHIYAPNKSRDSNHNIKPHKPGKLKRFGSFLMKKDKVESQDNSTAVEPPTLNHDKYNSKSIKIRNLSLSPNARREKNRNVQNLNKDFNKKEKPKRSKHQTPKQIQPDVSLNTMSNEVVKNQETTTENKVGLLVNSLDHEETEVKTPIKSFPPWNKPAGNLEKKFNNNNRQRKVLVHIETRDEICVENGHPVWSADNKFKTPQSNGSIIRDHAYFESSFVGKLSSVTCSTPGESAKCETVKRDNISPSKQDTGVKSETKPQVVNPDASQSILKEADKQINEPYFEVNSASNDCCDGDPIPVSAKQISYTEATTPITLQNKSLSCENVSAGRVFAVTGVASDKIPDIIARKHPYLSKTSSEPLRHMARCLRQIQRRGGASDKPKLVELDRHCFDRCTKRQDFIVSPRRCFSDSNLSTPNKSHIVKDSSDQTTNIKRNRSTKTYEILTRMRERIQRLELLRETTPAVNQITKPCSGGLSPISGCNAASTTTKLSISSSPIMMSLPLPKIAPSVVEKPPDCANKIIVNPRNSSSSRFMRLLQAELKKREKKSATCLDSCSENNAPPTASINPCTKATAFDMKQGNILQTHSSSATSDISDKSINFTTQSTNKYDPSTLRSTSNSSHINVVWRTPTLTKFPRDKFSSSSSNSLRNKETQNDDANMSKCVIKPNEKLTINQYNFSDTRFNKSWNGPNCVPNSNKDLKIQEQIVAKIFTNKQRGVTRSEGDDAAKFEVVKLSPSESRRSEMVKSTVLSEMEKIKQKYSFVLPCMSKLENEATQATFTNRLNRLSSSSLEAFQGSESSSFVSSNTSINSRDTSVLYEYVLSSDSSSTLCNSSASSDESESDDTITNFDDCHLSNHSRPVIKWLCNDIAFSTEL